MKVYDWGVRLNTYKYGWLEIMCDNKGKCPTIFSGRRMDCGPLGGLPMYRFHSAHLMQICRRNTWGIDPLDVKFFELWVRKHTTDIRELIRR